MKNISRDIIVYAINESWEIVKECTKFPVRDYSWDKLNPIRTRVKHQVLPFMGIEEDTEYYYE